MADAWTVHAEATLAPLLENLELICGRQIMKKCESFADVIFLSNVKRKYVGRKKSFYILQFCGSNR